MTSLEIDIENIIQEYDLQKHILDFIHEWELQNNNELILDFDVFYSYKKSELINDILKKYGKLRTVPFIVIPYLPENVKYLDCGYNMIIKKFPESLESLTIQDFTEIPQEFPISLKKLYYCNKYQRVPPPLPPNLLYLELGSLRINELMPLPSTLEYLSSTCGNITKITNLPPNLKKLCLSYNDISYIDSLPPKLKHLDLENNALTELPALPKTLKRLICCKNFLTHFPHIPESVRFISYYGNKFTSQPQLPPTVLEYIGGEFGYVLNTETETESD